MRLVNHMNDHLHLAACFTLSLVVGHLTATDRPISASIASHHARGVSLVQSMSSKQVKRECAAILEGLKVWAYTQLVVLARVQFLIDGCTLVSIK